MNSSQNQTPAVPVDKASPAYAVKQYNTARSNLLIALVLTVINIVTGCIGANFYLLFSISFPYLMFDISDILWSIPAVAVLALYVVYYLCSKKKPGFMIAALVTFILDFLFLIGYSLILTQIPEAGVTVADFLIDYATHVWVLVYLIIGTRYAKRYKAAITADPSLIDGKAFQNASLPVETAPQAQTEFPTEEYPETQAEFSANPAAEQADTDQSSVMF